MTISFKPQPDVYRGGTEASRMETYTVVVHEAIGCGAGFWAEVEELPGCIAFADNLGRLSEDVTQAVHAHVQRLRAEGKPIPAGRDTEIETRTWRIAVPV